MKNYYLERLNVHCSIEKKPKSLVLKNSTHKCKLRRTFFKIEIWTIDLNA
jgi:hypothetical protein